MGTVLAVDTLTNIKLIGADVTDILVNTVTAIMGILYVLRTWKNTDSPLKTFVALIVAGAIWWGILNMTVLRDQAGETWNRDGAAASPSASAPVLVSGEQQ